MRSGSPHMAAPPWRATDTLTPHLYSHGGCDHQWPIGHSPQSPGKAVHSRGGVALLTWQPPLTCHGPTDPPFIFARGLWSSMAHWSFSTVPREGCALKSPSGSPHMAAPPWRATDQRTPHLYSHGGCDHQWPTDVTPESPGNAVHSREPKKWPLHLLPDGPIPTGQGAFKAPPLAPAACEKWVRQLQRRRRQSASKSKSCEKFWKSSKWAGLICVLGIYRGDYLQRAHKRASMETGGTWLSEAALRYGRSVRPCGIVRGRVRVGEGEMTYSPKRRFWAYLSDPRWLPRSETSESTVVTVLARSKTRTKVSWGIRLVGKFLDRQVSSPRPEEKDPRSAGVSPWPEPKVLDQPIGRTPERLWPGHSVAHPTSFDSVNRVADVVQSERGTERFGDDVADRPRFGDSSAKATALDSATRVQGWRSRIRRLGCDGRTL